MVRTVRLINGDALRRKVKRESNPYGKSSIDFESGKRVIELIDSQPTVQFEIIRCKDCKYWNKGSCECREHAVNCQDYMVGDIETEPEHFCGYAEKKEVTT